MEPIEKIEKLVKGFEITTDARKDQAVLSELLQAQADSKRARQSATGTNMWKAVKFAAAVIAVLSVACWFAVRNTDVPKHQDTSGNVSAVRVETPAENVSVISLNKAFRDGGMKAVEKQIDIAERKVKPTLKERITIDQLMCELGECEKI